LRLCLRCRTTFGGETWRCPNCGAEPERIDGLLAFAPGLAHGAEGFDPAHFSELARLEAGNFWFRARNRLILWALGRYFPDARSLLEVGCGTGYVLAGVAGARPALRLTGSEAATDGLAFAARRVPAAELVQMDARRIPFREEFDVAGAFDVIEHIEDDQAVLRELCAALAPGGGLLLTVPQHPALWSEYDVHAGHVRRYRRAELRAKVAGAGLEVVRMTSFVSLLLPLMFLSRLTQRAPSAQYDPLAELRIAAWLNGSLGAVLGVERALIRAGVSFPAGGSLLAVARKPPARSE
jgi:SAM-dependent methyltransferase